MFIDENFGCGGVDIRMNDGYEKIFIGKDCLFSWGIKMRSSDGHSVIDLNSDNAVNLPADIYIGNHVWVGEDVKILKSVFIPNNCVLGGFSVVTKKFSEQDSNSIIAGFPAKVVKSNINWDRQKADEYNNNLRLLDYKNKEIILDNKVNLKINNNQINYNWNTIKILQDVLLSPKTILEIFYRYEESLNDIIFQILLWKNKDTYFWKNIDFTSKDSKKGVYMIDFSLLKKVGKIKYEDVEYIEIRAKRINT